MGLFPEEGPPLGHAPTVALLGGSGRGRQEPPQECPPSYGEPPMRQALS